MDDSYLVSLYQEFQSVSGTLQNNVYHALKGAILNQMLPQEITESQISLALNVSRTPVREAMHKLSAEGFLEISHGRKAKVIQITEQDIADISLILRSLHKISIELCVAKITDAELGQLKELLDLMEYYVNRHDVNQLVRYNSMFHLKICEFGRNKWLYSIMQNLLDTSLVFRTRATARPGRAESGMRDHQRIYELLCQRDAEGLKTLVEQHVNSAFEQQ